MKHFVFVFAFCCVLLPKLSAQLVMGQWRTHFAYNSVQQVAQSPNKVFGVSEGSLFSVDKRDENVEYYSKLSGLNGTVVSAIEYDDANKSLVIVYSNGNIDILRSGGVENIPDLYNKSMATSKAVNSISFYNGKTYLSCDFGIVVLNLVKNEIAETYFIADNAAAVKVMSTVVYNGFFYAAAADGLYKADVTNPNLVNYEYWSKLPNLPGSGDILQVAVFGSDLLLLRGSKIYKHNADNSWTPILSDIWFYSLDTYDDRMLAYADNYVYQIYNDYSYTTIASLGTIYDAEYDRINQKYWFAGNNKGIVMYDIATTQTNDYIPNGPAVNTAYRMKFAGRKLFVVPGGRWAVQEGKSGDVMMYENGEWYSILNSEINAHTNKPVLDFMNVAVDPTDAKHFFVTSYGTGLYEFRNNAFYHHYHQGNSIINSCIPSNPDNYTRLDGAFYDNYGNLWLYDMGVDNPIKILLTNGNWIDYTIKIANESFPMYTIGEIIMDSQNPHYKWIPYARGNPGIVLLNDNGTPDNDRDDQAVFRSVFYDQDNNALSPNEIYCAAQDHDNTMWIGTDIGPILLSNPTQAFTSNFTCTRVKIPRNDGTDDADFLLLDEPVNAIAIDGANRKWIGTENSGVYLMSANGQETIRHFTTSNSPLTSNKILSIAINPETGEVFIGTGAGLVSYQSDAAMGGDSFGKIYAYPNPVRETYKGLITITGLVANTTVKITDIAGNLVCETISNGSLAVWDGKNNFGQRVSTGVYLAICLTEDGQERAITKILFIN